MQFGTRSYGKTTGMSGEPRRGVLLYRGKGRVGRELEETGCPIYDSLSLAGLLLQIVEGEGRRQINIFSCWIVK